MAEVKTYDPKGITIAFGSHIITGYAEDEFLSIEQTGDGTAATSGADGEVARSLSHNPLHRITLTLQQTSDSNDFLSDLLRQDRASGGGGVLPLQIRDLRGRSLFAAAQAWVVKWPNRGYANAVGNREWEIDAVESENYVGGNFA